jgi:anti-sigma28 factor (negative regulator of flagellin synthesis)
VADPTAAGDAAPADAERTGGAAVTDRVQLSDAARLRQRLKAEAGDPAASTADVGALRLQVENGTYAPSPRAIADRLLGELAADLLA